MEKICALKATKQLGICFQSCFKGIKMMINKNYQVQTPFHKIESNSEGNNQAFQEDELIMINNKEKVEIEMIQHNEINKNNNDEELKKNGQINNEGGIIIKNELNEEELFEKGKEAIIKIKELCLKPRTEFQKIFEEKEKAHGLVLYHKHYTQNKEKISVYITEWIVPCSANTFKEMLNDVELQKNLDLNIESFEYVKKINEFCSIYYLSYKKILMSSGRDFYYSKYSENNELDWCEGSFSIEGEDFPCREGKVRGNIILSGTFVCKIAGKEDECIVRTYSEINAKLSLPILLTRAPMITESKKFVNKFCDKIKENQNQNSL